MQKDSFDTLEQISVSLRALYDTFGYTRYRMSKFEEYDLYARNKDFLISEGVITFTDTNGKLMALKPDVTLSIVKNSPDLPEAQQKLYYNENVYRVSKGTRVFKEIMQVGLECLGAIDSYSVFEVLLLAAKSLLLISENPVLEISDLSILSDALDYASIEAADRPEILRLIGEKNLHELSEKLCELNVSKEPAEILSMLAALHEMPSNALEKLSDLCAEPFQKNLKVFSETVSALCAAVGEEILRVDFSALGDPNYYNGMIFKGYVPGVPQSVLSGGRYDALLRSMNRSSGAIGFAVYLDLLELLDSENLPYDLPAVLLYGEDDPLDQIEAAAARIRAQGESLCVLKELPGSLRAGKIYRLRNGETEVLS